MSADITERKLTTIFYADVAGYSRLTGQDETGTHQRVMQILDIVTTQISSAGGSVLRYAGDAPYPRPLDRHGSHDSAYLVHSS